MALNAKQQKAVKQAVANIINGDENSRSMPISVGDVFTFTAANEADIAAMVQNRSSSINGREVEWSVVITPEGEVPVNQIVRRRNGLELEGDTNSERLESFLTQVIEAGAIKKKVGGLKTREFKQEDGSTNISNYIQWAEVE